MFQAFDAVVGHGPFEGTVEMLREDGLQGFVDKGWLSTATDACDDDKFAEWENGIYMFEVIAGSALDDEVVSIAFPPFLRNRNG